MWETADPVSLTVCRTMSPSQVFIIILDMIPAVFGKLKDSGFFFDPVARDIETNFIPSLLEKVKTKVRFYTRRMIFFLKPHF